MQEEALSSIGPRTVATREIAEQRPHMETRRAADRCVCTVHGGDVHLVIECGVTHESDVPSRLPCRQDEFMHRPIVGAMP
jgi:hypothetical protein